MALEAAKRFSARLALGLLAREVSGGLAVPVPLVDREAVKCAVELAVAATIEAVAPRLSRGRRDRRDPAGARELCVGGEPIRAGDLTDQLRRRQRTAAGLGQLVGDESREFALEFADAGSARRDLADEIARNADADRLL